MRGAPPTGYHYSRHPLLALPRETLLQALACGGPLVSVDATIICRALRDLFAHDPNEKERLRVQAMCTALAEHSPHSLDQRRAALRNPERGPFPPLSEFLAMSHPLAVLAAAAAEQHQGETGEGQARVIRLSGEDAERLLDGAATDPSRYYIQARGFLDYLTDRASRAPLVPLTQALQSGQTLDDWLAQAGAAHGLPGSVEALEADWEAWLGEVRGVP